jgi:hypothetical protein
MNTPANWIDAVFLINLAKRTDRLAQANEELAKIGIAGCAKYVGGLAKYVTRFDAYGDLRDEDGRVNGNRGCTASHRAVLELIAFHRYERALVLEDDFMLRPAMAETFAHTFNAMTQELPADWRMLYLGGSYGENPKRRHSPHLIETNAVMTTSSYVIGWQQARRMAPHISGIGPIDSLFHRFNKEPGCFMTCPRLFVQRPSYSDLTERMAENVTSMEDAAHEDMLLEGKWETEAPTNGHTTLFRGKVQRREVSEASQLAGTEVIVEGQLYIVVKAHLPQHLPFAPWFRGEAATYALRLP